MVDEVITEDYLNEICDFTGLEAYLPLGILNLPADFGIMPGPGVRFSLTRDTDDGLIEVDEKVVEQAKRFTPRHKIWIRCANGNIYTREDFDKRFEGDPILELGWMRRHQGVHTPQGQVTASGGIIPNKEKPGTIHLGGGNVVAFK